jgi:uncharacterized protein YciI
MIQRIAASAFLVLLAVFAPVTASAQALPIPAEWSTHYAWFLVANPEYAPGSAAVEDSITAAHIQYQLRLHADGHAIVAGGLAPVAGDPLVGLTILRAESEEMAQALANADPAVRAGRLVARIRAWWVPTGQLP